jgi:hypothetical protein
MNPDVLKSNPDNNITQLRERVAHFKKQAQLLLERFQRGEISQTDAQTEARRINAEVGQAEREATELQARQCRTITKSEPLKS